YHRGPGFGRMLREVTESLQRLYRTRCDVVVMTSSGTGGLESAVANCCSPGDVVLVPLAGFFAERMAAIARAYGLEVRTIDYAWGQTVKGADISAALADAPAHAVLLTHSETSTGVVHDVEAAARAAKDAGALVIVDAVSSLGAVPFDFDGWGIDVAVSGSQKALSASPGLAFVAVSEAAWEAQSRAACPRFYFDWSLYKEYFARPDPESPWTPAISVLQGLHAALRLYYQDGPEAAAARHELLSRAVKQGVRALGLDLFGEDPEQAWTVTAIRAPEGIDANRICSQIRADFGIVLAPGQGPLKGKVFRIGHLGYYDRLDMLRGLAALEMTLGKLGHPVKRGAAVAAAEDVFADGE
ncbi:MAG TPA: alanine--glyoxylate aminotransferase family protein, partial [Actinomycetota bacterium]|nr:alanine--glyoxylate aminotransferase family protein [Actinomycetota bacterium]